MKRLLDFAQGLPPDLAATRCFEVLHEGLLYGGAEVAQRQGEGRRTYEDIKQEATLVRKMDSISVEKPPPPLFTGDAGRALKGTPHILLSHDEWMLLLRYIKMGAPRFMRTGISADVVEVVQWVEKAREVSDDWQSPTVE